MNKPASPPLGSHRKVWLAGVLLVLATSAAYLGTFTGPFLFDDQPAITENASIRQLWPLTTPLSPPSNGSGVTGRPLVNVSLAVNYAISGRNVWSYHAFNLLLHLGAGLALFGLVRRTLHQPVIPATLRDDALSVSFVIAALWLLHPMLTESVTSVIQRTESQMGFCYLLTLYVFVRGVQSVRPTGWLWLSVVICLLGMATKEVMASAPLVVFLFDRTFVAGSFRAAWRQRRGYYLGLAATWLLLAWLVLAAGATRGSVAGFGLGVTPWIYGLTQFKAIVIYLKLSVWPHPLVFDYGTTVVPRLAEVWWQGGVLLLLVGGTGWALWRRPMIGFLGAWFLVILAPSSSVLPLVTQTMAEHRMYLPLAAVLVLLTTAARCRFGRAALGVGLVVATGFAVLTVLRNRDYRSGLVLWSDTVAKVPDSPRAHFNLAGELEGFPDRQAEMLAQYEEALHLYPDYVETHVNLAIHLAQIPGRLPDAIAHVQEAIRLRPSLAVAHNNLANYLVRTPGYLMEGIAQYEQAIQLQPDYGLAHLNLANELAKLKGSESDAISHYEMALQYLPETANLHYALAHVLAGIPGRLPEAIEHYEAALRLQPDFAEAHNDLAISLSRSPGRTLEAITHFEAALALKPGDSVAHHNLANELAQIPGRLPEALEQYEAALRLNPDYAEAHCDYANRLVSLPGRRSDALTHYEAAIRVNPDFAQAHNNLGMLLAALGRLNEAADHLETATRLNPNYSRARAALEKIRAKLAAQK